MYVLCQVHGVVLQHTTPAFAGMRYVAVRGMGYAGDDCPSVLCSMRVVFREMTVAAVRLHIAVVHEAAVLWHQQSSPRVCTQVRHQTVCVQPAAVCAVSGVQYATRLCTLCPWPLDGWVGARGDESAQIWGAR